MEGEHAQMWQIPCKMTNSSSKPLQNTRQMVPAKKSKKKSQTCPTLILKLFHTLFVIQGYFTSQGLAGS